MRNVDDKMKQLITDYNILSYLNDLLSYSNKHEEFFESNTFIELHEHDGLTAIKYLKRFIFTISTFVLIVLIIKSYLSVIPIWMMYFMTIIVSLIYGKFIIVSKNDLKDLRYQLKTKRAAQYALEHYTYDQFLVFLDKYLSELSSMSYNKQLKSKNN